MTIQSQSWADWEFVGAASWAAAIVPITAIMIAAAHPIIIQNPRIDSSLS